MVDFTALLRGAPGIALGDAVGSSLVDSALSIGAGPIVAPAAVTPSLAVPATVYTLIAVGLVASLLAGRRRHGRLSALVLVALYALSYVIVIQTAMTAAASSASGRSGDGMERAPVPGWVPSRIAPGRPGA